MKHALFVTAALALAAPVALAQPGGFGGVDPGLNAAMPRTTTEVMGTGSDSGNGAGLGLQAQYSFALNPQWLLGIGLTIGNTQFKAGTVNAMDFSTHDRLSIDITPSYALSDSLLVFGKVSSLAANSMALTTATGLENSFSLSGLGYGFGVRTMVDKNMFFQGTYDMNRYNDLTTTKTGSSVFSMGVGYRF